ncbi:MAG: universal stress protein [Desulfobacterales bacterium]
MEKKILVAVDDSRNAKQAIAYVVNLSSLVKNLSCTLFHVQPAISQFLTDEAKSDVKAQSALEKLKRKNARASLSMLEQCRAVMCENGIGQDCIELKSVPRKTGLAKDIIDYAQEKKYDAIVIGRRGLGFVQEVFMGSTTKKLVEHSKLTPLWIVDGKVKSSRVLIAIDGSESALRAVDHLSFVMEGSKDVKITLFHVIPMFRDYCPIDFDEMDADMQYVISQGEKKCVEKFFVHAFRKFANAGIERDQIEIKEVSQRNVGRAIVEELQQQRYGTVVVGRRGQSSAFFMGSVSTHVLDRASDCALWLVP